ncbi:mannitol dehydrogenase family protein [Ilyobacter sp.]|uniref:mannitol dehydrogenase family protein n=1 Tax=Ilyobacter sp. TaxID=3100343 RepID=UPI00356AB48E
MKLSNDGLKNRDQWLEKGYELPIYDIEKIKENTIKEPVWLHFGAGNLFRAFTAANQNKLLNEGKSNKGIIVAEGYDYEIIEKAYIPFDNLSLLVTLKPDGNIKKEVIGSVVSSLTADTSNKDDWDELKRIFKSPSLQMVSLTVTEKGYSIFNNDGEILPFVLNDLNKSYKDSQYFMGKLTALCYERFLNGSSPVALVSMDNCSENGIKLYNAVLFYAKKWVENKFMDEKFVDYLKDSAKVSFPCTMIDKITPRPNAFIKNSLKDDGFENSELIITEKNTYTSAFVNAEEPQYLVIEDNFPNGRPNLEESGVMFTDRKTVDKVERMKVCTCLNPLHTALAIFGCLLSYNSIADEMKDETLKLFVEKMAYEEGIKVVTDPIIINPSEFIKEVLEVRFPNPFLPDTPQRIATDTSQKIAIRFGETIKEYNNSNDLDVKQLKYIPLVIAGWCRYLMGIDDSGVKFELSSDPMLDSLKKHIGNIEMGSFNNISESLKPILSDEKLMGINLYEIGMGEIIETYFKEFIKGSGAIRETLNRYL